MANITLTVNTLRLRDRYYRERINLILDELAERTDLTVDTVFEFPQIQVIEDGLTKKKEDRSETETPSTESVASNAGSTSVICPMDQEAIWTSSKKKIPPTSPSQIITATGKVIDTGHRNLVSARKFYVPSKKITSSTLMTTSETTTTADKPVAKKYGAGKFLSTLQDIIDEAVMSDPFVHEIKVARRAENCGVGLAGNAGTSQQDLGRLLPKFFDIHNRYPVITELAAMYIDNVPVESTDCLNIPNHTRDNNVRRIIAEGKDRTLFHVKESFCHYASRSARIVISPDIEADVDKINNSHIYRRSKTVLIIKYLIYSRIVDTCGVYPIHAVTGRITYQVLETLKKTERGQLHDMAADVLSCDGKPRLTGPRAISYYRMLDLVHLGIFNYDKISGGGDVGGRGLVLFPDSIMVEE